jgi:hypothetical protein
MEKFTDALQSLQVTLPFVHFGEQDDGAGLR